jgi:hypothetical protein
MLDDKTIVGGAYATGANPRLEQTDVDRLRASVELVMLVRRACVLMCLSFGDDRGVVGRQNVARTHF